MTRNETRLLGFGGNRYMLCGFYKGSVLYVHEEMYHSHSCVLRATRVRLELSERVRCGLLRNKRAVAQCG